MRVLLILVSGVCASLSGVSWAKTSVWVYASAYKENMAAIEKLFEAKHPDLDLQVFQAGSEKIQAKVEAELIAQKPQVDVLMVSDPFWTLGLEKRELLARSPSPPTPYQFSPYRRVNYFSAGVLVSHPSLKSLPEPHPRSFIQLPQPHLRRKIHMGSPLESGSAFATVAALQIRYGWPFFEKLGELLLTASGGNSAVIQKVETGEKKMGIVLLENALAARKKGSPIEWIIPDDGAILIPSVQAVLKSSSHLSAAWKFADFVLTPEAQEALRQGNMHPVLAQLPPPDTAPPLSELVKNGFQWSTETLETVSAQSKSIKKKYSELILE